ncbi:hypothetical protein PVAND_011377 [Polypedilum vanderplanki]|uniref:Uncharacterized protein n=1 Tax=Polypedilum vanderplanki TaxID=319348 RepID=A0A9J6CID1_POLVA|nr:hypothetical protein PVAND_011377 [Polypedilum vanderplanki]
MKNLIDTMEEDMMKMISISKSSVTPVFPESMDFEILLRNKFDTDETLSEFWNLDTLFWWKKCFKLTHWKMPMFTINFTCQQSNEEVNECTIPIIFKDVRLYLNAEYQLKSNESKRNLLLRHEFKKATNMTENFTSMCSSSKDLFSFLNIYHEHVMKVVHLVDNFFKILFKYEAVYFQQPQNLIKKVCFFENEKEVLNLQVSIDDFLEKISVKNLCLKGKRFTYCIQPRNDFKEIRGLMFLEQLLFNTEKFLHINTIRSVIE